MRDLVSRSALLEKFETLKNNPNNRLYEVTFLDGAMSVIDAAPAVDAEPVRHGEWRYKKQYVAGGKGQTFSVWQCSCCRKKERRRTDYCPNCGARMDEEDDE